MPMNLPQLLNRTPKSRFESAKYVKLTQLKMGYDRDGKAIAYCQSYSTHRIAPDGTAVPNLDRFRYVTLIRFIDNKLNAHVSCSCEDFTFTFEVALHKKDAAEIEYSNGELPLIRNPKMIPGACKHVIKLLQTIKSKVPKVRKT